MWKNKDIKHILSYDKNKFFILKKKNTIFIFFKFKKKKKNHILK